MKNSEHEKRERIKHPVRERARLLAFPCAVALAYALLWLLSPAHALAALKVSGGVCLQLAPALLISFGAMVALNLFVRPAHVTRLLGEARRAKGIALSTLGGILSMGPIYAWYPLLKDLRTKGASDFHLANFLCCRAVKPPLLPFLIASFGWLFTLVLTALTLTSSLLTAILVNHATRRRRD